MENLYTLLICNNLHGWPQCNDPNPNVMCEECDCWKHFSINLQLKD